MSVNGLGPYPAYRESGVEWLGKVPQHWEVRRTKTVLKQRTEKGFPNEPLLAATQTKGVVRKEQYENRTVLALKDLHLLKLVQVGDFVISLRSFQGGIEFARERGIISPAYTVLFPVQSEDHGYLAHLFKSAPYVENLSLFVTGIRQGQNIDYAKLGRSRLPLPPTREQRAIVRFLDDADRRIRRYIRAKERLIELLQERKRALIHEAVTGRTDVQTGQPYPAYKDSGVQWLGKVPEHWEVRKLRSLFRRHGSGTTPPRKAHFGGSVSWVMSGDLSDSKLDSTMRNVTRRAVAELPALKVYPPESLVVAMYGATIGRTGILSINACTNQACCVLADPLPDTSAPFVQAVLVSARGELVRSGVGGGQPNINAEVVRAFRVPSPPFGEQTAIVGFLDYAVRRIRAAISAAQRQIALLREYRTRLIADVVTGKLDVREASARLPETGPLSADRNRTETIPPESNLHSTANEIAKEAST